MAWKPNSLKPWKNIHHYNSLVFELLYSLLSVRNGPAYYFPWILTTNVQNIGKCQNVLMFYQGQGCSKGVPGGTLLYLIKNIEQPAVEKDYKLVHPYSQKKIHCV